MATHSAMPRKIEDAFYLRLPDFVVDDFKINEKSTVEYKIIKVFNEKGEVK